MARVDNKDNTHKCHAIPLVFSVVFGEWSRRAPGEALAGCNCTEDGQVIEAADGADRPGERYVVDSWFVDNGEPAVVLPLAEWLKGGGPNVQ